MKITKTQLRKIIKEELGRVLSEKLQEGPPEDFLHVLRRKAGGQDGFQTLVRKFGLIFNFGTQHPDGSITMVAKDEEKKLRNALQSGMDATIQGAVDAYNQMGRGGTVKVAGEHRSSHGDDKKTWVYTISGE
tara:strand:- start:158 stop:553 length:396 start_codon:yes stop_codon:yes gene_type:complete